MGTVFLVLIAIWFEPQAARGQVWPTVQPVDRQVSVDLRSEEIQVDVPIKTTDDRIGYYFACRGGSERYLDSLPDNWVGPLMCTLAAGDRPTEASLLSEDDSAAWFSRGQFRSEDLVGDCGRYPEYGRQRAFRLRGMRLKLEANDVKADAAGVAHSFVLSISVVPDASATTAQAAQPGFLDPHRQGRSCQTVIKGRDPRMCRNPSGSFDPCKD
jgi:hypothetical protein